MIKDLQTEVLLSRLCTRVLKQRLTVLRTDGVVTEAEDGFICRGWWEGKQWCMAVVKEHMPPQEEQ